MNESIRPIYLFYGDEYCQEVGFGGWNLFKSAGHFVANTVKTAARTVDEVTKPAQDVVGKVGDAVNKVPIVGGAVTSSFNYLYHAATAQANVLVAIGEGQRIDTAVLNQFKKTVQDVKQVAPYAQMVISTVPGIGQGVSGVMGAGLALAEGQPVDEVVKAGLLSSLPGGPLVKAAATAGLDTIQRVAKGQPIDVASLAQTAGGSAASALGLSPAATKALTAGIATVGAIASGKPLDKAATDAAITSLPLPDTAKQAMVQATGVMQDLAAGKPLDATLMSRVQAVASQLPPGNPLKTGIEAALKKGGKLESNVIAAVQGGIADNLINIGAANLPPDVQKGLKTGMALGTASVRQALAKEQLTKTAQPKLQAAGLQMVRSNPVFAAARTLAGLKGATAGFDLAAGLLQHQAKTFDIATIRNSIPAVQKLGFDMACALRIGLVSNPQRPGLTPGAQAARAISLGMQSYTPERKAAMVAVMTKSPSAAVGVKSAVKQVAATRDSFFVRLLRALGLRK